MLRDIAVLLVLAGIYAWWVTRPPRESRRPGHIDRRPGFGHGINHPTFREVRRGMREARRFRRGRY